MPAITISRGRSGISCCRTRTSAGDRPGRGSRPGPPALSAPVHSRTAAVVLLGLLAVVWGVHWVVVKIGLESMPPFQYATLRVAGGLVTVVAILGAQRRLVAPARSDVPIVLSLGLGQIAVGVIAINVALQFVAAGRSSVIVYSMPIWVAVLLAVVFRVRPSRWEIVGLVLGIAGLVALLNPAAIDLAAPGELAGTLILLANAVSWAAATIHVRRHRWTRSPLELQPWFLLTALVPIAVLALVLESGRTIRWDLGTVLILLYSGPLATAFATWASQSITRSLGSQASATGFLAVPVVGLASGAIVLHEAIGIADLVGFGLVLAGIAVTSFLTRQPIADEAAPAG